MENIKITIITINFNNKQGLEKTIKSVQNQTYKNIEYIIIDGGSTDGSKEIIEQNKNSFAYWISEKDKGVYNAMNKGILKSTGTYLMFLNSGDHLYSDDSIAKFIPHLEKEPDLDIIYGDTFVVEKDNKTRIGNSPDKVDLLYFVRYSLPHPTSLIKRDLFGEIGLYDENFKMVSDWKFYLIATIKRNKKYKHIKDVITTFYLDGLSTDWKFCRNERFKILEQEFPLSYKDIIAYSDFQHSRIIKFLRKYNLLKY